MATCTWGSGNGLFQWWTVYVPQVHRWCTGILDGITQWALQVCGKATKQWVELEVYIAIPYEGGNFPGFNDREIGDGYNTKLFQKSKATNNLLNTLNFYPLFLSNVIRRSIWNDWRLICLQENVYWDSFMTVKVKKALIGTLEEWSQFNRERLWVLA